MKPTNELLNNIRKLITGYANSNSAPIFFYKCKNTAEFRNGTIFFLKTSHQVIGITAYHVYEEYLNFKSDSNTKLQIGDELFKPEENIIDKSKELDLITFEIKNNFLFKINKDAFPRPEKRISVKKNQTVFFAGYPGGDRIHTSFLNVNFGIFGALCVVESVSQISIKLVLDEQYVIDSPDKMPIDYKLGGISGAALFSIEESESGITLFSLGGVVSEAGDTLKIISCIPIEFISDDGKIIKNN